MLLRGKKRKKQRKKRGKWASTACKGFIYKNHRREINAAGIKRLLGDCIPCTEYSKVIGKEAQTILAGIKKLKSANSLRHLAFISIS